MIGWRHTYIASMVFAALSSPALAGHAEDELLGVLKVGHRAAQQAITTISCDVAIEEGNDKFVPTAHGHYWRSPTAIRVKEIDEQNGHQEDWLTKGDQILSLGTKLKPARGEERYAAARRSTTTATGSCDVWARMLLSLPGHKSLSG